MTDFLTIGGETVAATATFPVTDPALGEHFAEAPDSSDEQLDAAIASATRAFVRWRTDDDARRSALRASAAVLRANADDLGALLTREQGKPLIEATGEIGQAADWMSYFAELETPVEVLQDDPYSRVELHHEPIGPVAAIAPWNAPVGLAFWKIAPALRAGNTVVVKPSPLTPLTTLRIGELLAEVLPEGVLTVITGLDPLGEKLTRHPGIRKISFTGSTGNGRRVALAAADDLKRVTLELGGNDPAIILEDADVETAAAGIFGSAMTNVGQICVVPKRVYVPRSLYHDVVDAFVVRAQRAQLGSGLDAGTTHGPMNNPTQLARVEGLIEAAVASGATIAAGGGRLDRPGYFHQLTVLTNVTDDMAVVAEEQFGPVLPVLVYDDLDDAFERANNSHFGLGSSIWTADPARGAALARRVEAGTTWINAHLYLLPNLPFGGVKQSGIGVENGPWALGEYTTPHVVYQNLLGSTPWP